MSEAKPRTTDIFARRQRWFKALLGVLAGLLLILTLLPVGIRLVATSWLEDHGVKQASIDNIDLNLFNGTFAIEGLNADEGLKIGRLSVDVDWWPLFSHRMFVRSVAVKGVIADLHQQESGQWQLSTIVLDAPSPQAEQPKAEGDPWQVVLNHIDVSEVHLNARGKLDNDSFELSLPLNVLNISLQKAEESGGQSLKNIIELGKVSFKGLGYTVTNSGLDIEQSIYLPAIGSDIAADLKMDGLNLNLNGFSLTDEGHGVQLLTVETIQLANASLQGTSRARFDQLSVRDIALPKTGDDSLGSIGNIALKEADLDLSGTYRFKELSIDGLQAAIKKLKSGKLLVLGELESSKDVETPKMTEAKSAEKSTVTTDGEAVVEAGKGKTPVLYIEQFVIGKGSSFAYRDESLFPPFDTKMEIEQFKLAPIDSAGKEPGKLNAQLKLNKNGSLALNGDITPNPGDFRSDLKITLKHFDMPGLTGFVEGDFGHAIKTGQFNLESSIKVADKKIDAKNKLLIRKLVLEKAKQPGRAEQSLGMPVDMALDMLRDDRGDITMDVPISGHLDDPNINVSDVINQALVSSMSAGALTYAKLLLQPYGAIIMAAEYAAGAAKDASKPKLTPIQFAERSSSLSPEMGEYSAKIATLMQQKDFRLQICGVATRIEGGGVSSDRPKIMDEEQLLKLAEARSDAVMKVIQGQGIAADRLFNCRPAIDEAKSKALPRVDLILD